MRSKRRIERVLWIPVILCSMVMAHTSAQASWTPYTTSWGVTLMASPEMEQYYVPDTINVEPYANGNGAYVTIDFVVKASLNHDWDEFRRIQGRIGQFDSYRISAVGNGTKPLKLIEKSAGPNRGLRIIALFEGGVPTVVKVWMAD